MDTQELDPGSVADWLAVRCDRLRQVTGPGGSVAISYDRVNQIIATLRAAPDHSMCARLVPSGMTDLSWALRSPNGSLIHNCSDDQARERGYAIPEPEPTVVERAVEVIAEDIGRHDNAERIAGALADAGLLVRDGEQ